MKENWDEMVREQERSGLKSTGFCRARHDVYRRDVLSTNLRRRMPQRVAWTNATFDQETRAMAARHGIELREGKHLEAELKAAEMHLGAILEMEAERFGSLKDIEAALKHL